MGSFYEIAIQKAKKQTALVDRLTKNTPFLKALPMMPTSDGLSNVAEELVSIASAEEVDFDSTLPTVDVESDLLETQLSKFGAQMTVGIDKLKNMNKTPQQYFAIKAEKVAKVTGMNIEYAMMYNLLRSKAIAASNYTKVGGAAGANYSIIIATFEPGENIGLYDPNGFGRGEVMDLLPLNNGAPHKITANGKKFTGYAMDMSTYFGIQIANVNAIYALVNIDIANAHTPTETMIDDALDAVEADPASTMMIMHPRIRSLLGEKFKSGNINMVPSDKKYDSRVLAWNDIPLIGTRNMLKATEADVA